MADRNLRRAWAAGLHQTAEAALEEICHDLRHSPDAQDHLVGLINQLCDRDRRFVLYAGAGCNKQVKVKQVRGRPHYQGLLWKELLEGLLDELGSQKRARFLASLKQRADGAVKAPSNIADLFEMFADRLLVAWFLTECFPSRRERDEAIVRLVEPSVGAKRRSPFYQELLKLPFRDVVTTNYDSNLKHFLGGDIAEIATTQALARSPRTRGRPRLFYMHGTVSDLDEGLVLDRFDYGRLLARRDGILDYVTYLLRDLQVIYIGFALDDPTFNVMESRLQDLHGTDRPQSYAFVNFVTEQEREVWHKRRLEIIDYGNHKLLTRLFKNINTICSYVSTCEPNRPPVDDPRADRARVDIDASLRAYASGDFGASLRDCRAALSSKLFRRRNLAGAGRPGAPLFNDLAEVCDLRIRMALNHYKLSSVRDSHEREWHQWSLEMNIEGAEESLREIRTHYESASATHKTAILALTNSLAILKARQEYHKGQFESARQIYREVASQVTKDAMRGGVESPDSMIWKLKLREGYDYALCQISRIEYQLLDDLGRDRLTGRKERLSDLKKVIDGLERSRRVVEKTWSKCRGRPEWLYYQSSLTTIHGIALWTTGRHALRACRDVIPTRDERSEKIWEMLTEGIEYLKQSPRLGRKSEWKPSPRWRALRYRYLCRGHALRWVVAQDLGQGRRANDDDLVEAYAAIRAAIDETTGPGLERQRVASLLEATRLNILVLYGEQLRRGPSIATIEGSPLSRAAGLHYLDTAFVEMQNKQRGREWLELLGGRLATYFAVVASLDPKSEFERLSSDRLKKFMSLGVERMTDHVVKDYERFGEEMGTPAAFNERIKSFRECVATIQGELYGSAQ